MSATFTFPMRVRFAECDPQGIVFNSRYLEYFDVAITEFWREAIGPFDAATAAADVELVVAEAGIRYRELAAVRRRVRAPSDRCRDSGPPR